MLLINNLVNNINNIVNRKELRTNVIYLTTRCNFSCKYCVVSNTRVLMSDFNNRFIKDIKIGDEIIGFDENRKYTRTIVKNIFKRKINEEIYNINEQILITGDHPVLSDNNNFYKISDVVNNNQRIWKLNINKKKNYYSEEFKEIEKVFKVKYNDYVYNLETDSGTYIANNYLVHNCFENDKKKDKDFLNKTCSDQEIENFVYEAFNREFDNPGRCFTVMGGEPFCAYDKLIYLFDIVKKYFSNYGTSSISMFTNASWFGNKRNIEKFKNIIDYYKKYNIIITFTISYDGPEGQKLRLDKANYLENIINNLYKENFDMRFSYTVNVLNYKNAIIDIKNLLDNYNSYVQINLDRMNLENLPDFNLENLINNILTNFNSYIKQNRLDSYFISESKNKSYSNIRNYQLPGQELINYNTDYNFTFDQIVQK
jgi:pyruvate-formate lyase-activating enzyme